MEADIAVLQQEHLASRPYGVRLDSAQAACRRAQADLECRAVGVVKLG